MPTLAFALLTAVLACVKLPSGLAEDYVLIAAGVAGVYGWDKGAAMSGKVRVPERFLQLLAVASPFGAQMGRVLFNHKTMKTGFTAVINLAAATQLAAFLLVT